ncbi:hypothetical protein CBR_g24043 [Chara braunii]|uniref:HotDog ACOT-type domain-containing protein n=1 Tax=Chara braunii TaxID=69332 RepID=A0A388L5L8_CHABU|nr:hypothetical protein CBR_g24043 [Chara braunii]|eukprot:GBG77596.1 hypothetical protein CBR_g24043 [Chara braunii]
MARAVSLPVARRLPVAWFRFSTSDSLDSSASCSARRRVNRNYIDTPRDSNWSSPSPATSASRHSHDRGRKGGAAYGSVCTCALSPPTTLIRGRSQLINGRLEGVDQRGGGGGGGGGGCVAMSAAAAGELSPPSLPQRQQEEHNRLRRRESDDLHVARTPASSSESRDRSRGVSGWTGPVRHVWSWSVSSDSEATRPGQHRSPIVDRLWRERQRMLEGPIDVPPPSVLLTRTPSESRCEMVYSFSTDRSFAEQYRNPWGYVRVGKVLEDLDALAGSIAYVHCTDDDVSTRPLLIVTASVDKISLKNHLLLDRDMKIEGQVTWVGRSSIEIRVKVMQRQELLPSTSEGGGPGNSLPDEDEGEKASTWGIRRAQRGGEEGEEAEEEEVLVALYTFVARDYQTNKAVPVNRLAPETAEEKRLFEEGQARDRRRKELRSRQQQRLQGVPSISPIHLMDDDRLHESLSEGRILQEMPALSDGNSILIRDTQMESTMICMHQEKNIHGKIFGGFLMRQAYELAFATCYVFSGLRPVFLENDQITFHRPVDVGDLLRLKGCVLYTEKRDDPSLGPLIRVQVVAYITKPEKRSSEVSNTFYFTFSVNAQELKQSGRAVRRVLPATEEEARIYVTRYEADHPPPPATSSSPPPPPSPSS